MNTGILIIESVDYCFKNDLQTEKTAKLLGYKGYDIKVVLRVESKFDLEQAIAFLKQQVEAVIVCGNVDAFYDTMSENYNISRTLKVLEIDNIIYSFMPQFNEDLIENTVIPALNSKCKTFYNTYIFKTFGKTEAELRELLKNQIKNKNRIVFRFIENLLDCEIQIRYSSKTSKPVIDSTILETAKVLQDFTYANSDVSLEFQVADILKVHKKTICIAESFTGGGVTAELVKLEGISKVLKEGLVLYSNESKIKRAQVEKNIIDRYGAVSIETVYEMAANILIDNECDISLATTGNAGPTSEKPGETGVCFIAVGNKRGIHIYKYNFKGSRQEVIECGIKAALFNLYKKLNENEFLEMLQLYQNNQVGEPYEND